jgi:hypothetical protein
VAQERVQLHPRHHQPNDQPHGTHPTAACDRLKAWGDNVRGILLPTRINDFIGLELKHLQKDTNFQGLRPQLMGILADVSIVPTSAERINIRLFRGRRWRRALWYMTSSRTRWSSTRRSQPDASSASSHLCVETYGRFRRQVIEFLKELAETASQRKEALDCMPLDIGAHNQFVARQVRRYMTAPRARSHGWQSDSRAPCMAWGGIGSQ